MVLFLCSETIDLTKKVFFLVVILALKIFIMNDLGQVKKENQICLILIRKEVVS